MPIYYRKDGQPTNHPPSRELARKKKSLRYDSGEVCPVCNECTIRFTHNDECVHCKRLEAIEYYNNNHEDARNPQEAQRCGAQYFITSAMCEKAGHLGIRTLDNECAFCAQEKTERKKKSNLRNEARERGDMWYTPTEPCKNCGVVAPRRVNNNSCRQCEINNSSRSPDQQLMEDNPDMVISRKDARTLGMTVYRTGKPCSRGHTDFRYVSTGNCVACHKGR